MFADLQSLIANVNTTKEHKFTAKDFLRTWQTKQKTAPTGKQIAEKLANSAKSLGAVSVRDLIRLQEEQNNN